MIRMRCSPLVSYRPDGFRCVINALILLVLAAVATCLGCSAEPSTLHTLVASSTATATLTPQQVMLLALSNDDADAASGALDAGLDINGALPVAGPERFSPLTLSVILNAPHVRKVLLDHGPRFADEDWLAIRSAIRMSDVDAVKTLVAAAGAVIPKQTTLLVDAANRTPLMIRTFLADSIRATILGTSQPSPQTLLNLPPTIWVSSAADPAVVVATYLLDSGFDVNAADHGQTSLAIALENGDVFLAEVLITRGANYPAGTNIWNNFLVEAVRKGNVPGVRELIAKSIDVSRPDSKQEYPLNMAIVSGNPEIAADLITDRADPNEAPTGQHTPLVLAAESGMVDVVQHLLDSGAKVDLVDPLGESPLSAAVRSAHLSIVGALLQARASPNIRLRGGLTILHDLDLVDSTRQKMSMAKPEQLAAVKALANAGFDFTSRDDKGRTVLQTAFGQSYYSGNFADLELMNALVLSGEKIDSQTLFAAADYNEVLKWLLDHGGDPNATAPDGSALIMQADDASAVTLIRAGAVLKTLADEQSWLFRAVGARNKDLLELMLAKQVDPNFKADVDPGLSGNGPMGQATPLEVAVWNGEPEIVRALAEAGADLYCTDDLGRTVLHRIVDADALTTQVRGPQAPGTYVGVLGNPTVQAAVSALIEEGYDLSRKDHDGETVLDIAATSDETKRRLQNVIAGVSSDGTALHLAVRKNDSNSVDVILSGHRIDLNAHDKLGRTALTLALSLGERDIARMLLEHGALLTLNQANTDVQSDAEFELDPDLNFLFALQLLRTGAS